MLFGFFREPASEDVVVGAALDLDDGIDLNGHIQSKERPMRKDHDEPNSPPFSASALPQTPSKRKSSITDVRRGGPIGTPSKMITKYFSNLGLTSSIKEDVDSTENALLAKITASTTNHATSDHILEYRVEIDPNQLIELTQSGIAGVRDEPEVDGSSSAGGEDDVNGKKKAKRKPSTVDPFSRHRIWVPASMLTMVEKELVDAFEEAEELKRAKKGRKGSRAGTSKVSLSPKPKPKKLPIHKKELPPNSDSERFHLDGVSETDESNGSDGSVAGRTDPIRARIGPKPRTTGMPILSPLQAGPSKPRRPIPKKTVTGPIRPDRPRVKAAPKRHQSLVSADSDWDDLFPPSAPTFPTQSHSPPPLSQRPVAPSKGKTTNPTTGAIKPKPKVGLKLRQKSAPSKQRATTLSINSE